MLTIDNSQLEKAIQVAVDKAIERHALKEQLPPLLTRKQFMELVGISASKCNELFNREDFPVNREFGHPRVPTKELMEWISHNTEWTGKYFRHNKIRSVI